VFVPNARYSSAQGAQIVDIRGVCPDGMSESCRLRTSALMRCVEDVLELGIVVQQTLVEMRGNSNAMFSEHGGG